MNMAKHKVVLENRAYEGVRLRSIEDLVIGNRGFSYEICWHHGKQKFVIEEDTTFLDNEEKPTYMGHVAYCDSVDDCFEWLLENKDIEVFVKGSD